jgi:ATP-dependent RNA helicase DBP3
VGDTTQDPNPTYREHEELTALPQADIDKFILEQNLVVEDPLDQSHRPITSFEYLPVKDESERAPFANFKSPTPIQAACWPHLLSGRDVVGVAETGSGKTLAFGLPCVQHIETLSSKQRKAINACIVSPTRELAMQIFEQLEKLAQSANLNVSCVYGGVHKDIQRPKLAGTNILVATPGRLNDFMQEGAIDLSSVKYLVLDEADRMLDKGFEDDVRKIISSTPSTGRQTLMFTATWPPSVRKLASTFMSTPVKITIGDNADGELRANVRISQEVEVIEDRDKQARLIELLKQYQSGKHKNDRILVFCLYKKEATRIEEFIRRKGFRVAGIHGDLSQQKRTESLDAFRRGATPLLVATDVAARGLDIPAVKVVINVTFPLTVEDYVHRIGR